MTDLRHPALRYRDVNRITDRRLIDVQWEPGVDAKNEWVLASLEDEEHRRRLLAWLDGEKVPPDSDALLFYAGESQLVTVIWREVLAAPERFFADRKFRVVSKDLDWVLEYWKEGTARFGRRPPKKG